MDVNRYLVMLRDNVTAPLIEAIEEYGEEGFSKADVDACEQLVTDYIQALSTVAADQAFIMTRVKDLVLALNELYARTDGALIETVTREALWEIIQQAAIETGLDTDNDDITEEWREW